MRPISLALLFLISLPASAEQADLAPLAAKLAAIRAMPKEQQAERGGSARLTEAKHLLRDWVEHEMGALDQADAASGLNDQLNKRLREAGLECDSADDPQGKRCEGKDDADFQFNALGYAGDLKFIWTVPHDYLALVTALGIGCGYDESVYVYRHRDDGWHRVLDSERDTYTAAAYKPQNVSDVLVSETADGKPPLVLTTGISPWCSSNWQAVYYRLWRIAPDSLTPQPLVDGEGSVFLTDTPVQARISPDDALIEYNDRSIDSGFFTRVVVRHFQIGADGTARRTAPFALTPRALVDEWLVRPWSESLQWTDPKARSRLVAWHRKLQSTVISGDYGQDGGRCRNDKLRWSIPVTFEDPPEPVPPLYFTVRWVPPADLTLLDIGPKPPVGCKPERVKVDDGAMSFPGDGP